MVRPNNKILLNTNIPQSVGNGFCSPEQSKLCFGLPETVRAAQNELGFPPKSEIVMTAY